MNQGLLPCRRFWWLVHHAPPILHISGKCVRFIGGKMLHFLPKPDRIPPSKSPRPLPALPRTNHITLQLPQFRKRQCGYSGFNFSKRAHGAESSTEPLGDSSTAINIRSRIIRYAADATSRSERIRSSEKSSASSTSSSASVRSASVRACPRSCWSSSDWRRLWCIGGK